MSGYNPYSPPESQDTAPPQADVKLFTPGQVAVAAFVGSPIAAGILLTVNERRLQREGAATLAMVGSVIATVAVFALSWVLPESFPGMVIPAAYTLTYRAIAKTRLERVAAGHGRASNWAVAGISVGMLLVVCAGLFGVIAYSEGMDAFVPRPSVSVGGEHEVLHDYDIPPEEARRLGDDLQEAGWFADGYPAAADLRQEGDGYVVCLVVVEDAWNDPETVDATRELEQILGEQGWRDLDVVLCDENLEVQSGT